LTNPLPANDTKFLVQTSTTSGISTLDFATVSVGTTLAPGNVSDVQLSSLADGQLLRYDDFVKKWVNDVLALPDLSDVTLTSPSVNQVLQYNGTRWVNATLPVASGGTVTSITAGSGLIGGTITTAGTISLGSVTALPDIVNDSGATSLLSDITVDSFGRVTQKSKKTYSLANPSLSNDFKFVVQKPAVTLGVGNLDFAFVTIGTTVNASTMDDILLSGLSDGQFLRYNDTSKKWENFSIPASTGGTVTSVTAGSGLTGGTITSSGTVALASVTRTDNLTPGTRIYTGITTNSTGQITSSTYSDYTLPIASSGAVFGNVLTRDGSSTNSALSWSTPNLTSGFMKDVTPGTPANAQILRFNGSSWSLASPTFSSAFLTDVSPGLVTATGSVVRSSGGLWSSVFPTMTTSFFPTTAAGGMSSNASATGQVLTWDNTASRWGPVAPSLGSAFLSDVALTSPAINQVLQYNGTQWVNATFTSGALSTLSDVQLASPFVAHVLYYDFFISKWRNSPLQNSRYGAGGNNTGEFETRSVTEVTSYNITGTPTFSTNLRILSRPVVQNVKLDWNTLPGVETRSAPITFQMPFAYPDGSNNPVGLDDIVYVKGVVNLTADSAATERWNPQSDSSLHPEYVSLTGTASPTDPILQGAPNFVVGNDPLTVQPYKFVSVLGRTSLGSLFPSNGVRIRSHEWYTASKPGVVNWNTFNNAGQNGINRIGQTTGTTGSLATIMLTNIAGNPTATHGGPLGDGGIFITSNFVTLNTSMRIRATAKFQGNPAGLNSALLFVRFVNASNIADAQTKLGPTTMTTSTFPTGTTLSEFYRTGATEYAQNNQQWKTCVLDTVVPHWAFKQWTHFGIFMFCGNNQINQPLIYPSSTTVSGMSGARSEYGIGETIATHIQLSWIEAFKGF
jgi:hypothetical protein